MIDAAGGSDVPSRSEIAAATAAAVVGAGRAEADERDPRFVGLADRVGIETLAALWSHAAPVSLPGALWALYLLQQWCRTNGEEVTRLWRAGQPYAEPHAAVAGVGEFASVQDVQQMIDAVLSGAYGGDFAVALERAAAVFRVVAVGRRQVGQDVELAARNERAADDLAAAAALWRTGALR